MMREPAVGDMLGNYRILGKLSVGGMGTIYRARHELLGRPAAVKLLHPHLTSDEELVARFFNEARATTAIRHPGIVEVYDFGYTDDGDAYLVMEFLEGVPLGKRIADRGSFSELEAATIARGIASALRAAHDKGIVHRDLKPDNIFLVPDADSPTGERVKVLDFGIAKLDARGPEKRARFTQTGVLIGTPLYMSPEQAKAAGHIDARADLYSLGCILYELLVGKPPFNAEGAGEVIVHHMFTQPTPPTAIRADISPELEDLVMRLLQKDPAKRYASASDVVAALTGAGAQVSARMSAQRVAASGAHVRVTGPSIRLTLIEESRQAPPPKRSSMPVVAAGITVALVLVAGVAIALALRGGGAAAVADSATAVETKPEKVEAKQVEPKQPEPKPPERIEPKQPEPPPAKIVEVDRNGTKKSEVKKTDVKRDVKPASGSQQLIVPPPKKCVTPEGHACEDRI